MNKKTVAASSLLAVIGVTWAGTTWYSGHKVESMYQHYIQQFNQETLSPVSIKLTSFERGFLSSKANWEVAYVLDPCRPNDKVTLAGYDNIHQGLIPSLGWASIESHIIWPDELQAKVKEIFADKEPLQIYSRINLLGKLTTTIKSPAVDWANQTATVNWHGLDGHLSLSGEKIAFDIKAPKLLVNSTVSNASKLSIEKIRYQGEQQSEQTFLPVGESSFEVHTIDMSNAGQQWAIKNLSLKNSNSIKNNLLSAEGNYKLKSIELNKKNIGDFSGQFLLNNLNAATMKQAYKSVAQLQKQCNPTPAQLIQAFKPVLKQGFGFKLDHLDLKLFDGHAVSSATVTVPALTDADLTSPEQIKQKITVDAALQLSEQLLTGVLQEINQLKGEPISPAEASQHVQILLQGYVERGWLSKTASGYEALFSLKAGQPKLNGQPLQHAETALNPTKPVL